MVVIRALAALVFATLPVEAAWAHLSGPHEPLILALRRAESVVIVRAEVETRRTAEGAETPVERVAVLDGTRTPTRFVLAQSGAHVHRLRQGESYIVPVKRSVSGRLLVDFSSEAPVAVEPSEARWLGPVIRGIRRGDARATRQLDVSDALRRGSPVSVRLAMERASLALSGVEPASGPVRSSWVRALAARAADAALDPVARSEAFQVATGLDALAVVAAVGEAALTWTPSALANQAVAFFERQGSDASRSHLRRCAQGLVSGVSSETRTRCQRVIDRGPAGASAP